MKKKVLRVLILLIILLNTLFIMSPFVLAATSGTGGIGDGGAGAANGKGTWNKRFGFYIAVFNKNNEQKGNTITKKAYDDYKSTKWTIENLNGWFKKGSNGNWTSHPTKFYDYLDIPYSTTPGDYSTLKSLISKAGITLKTGDYVLIEPFTQIDGNWITFRGIINVKSSVKVDSWPFHENYRSVAILLANAAKVGSDITVGGNEYKAPTSVCNEGSYGNSTSKNFCGYKDNKNIGFGITVVKYEDMYKGSLEITKVDSSNPKIKLQGAKFGLYSDSRCSDKIDEISTNSKGILTFENLPVGKYSYKETDAPDGYVTDSTCKSVTIEADKKTKKTVENTKKTGSIKLTKVDSENSETKLSGAIFTLYTKSGTKYTKKATCTSAIGTGICELKDLEEGTYYLKETAAPNGYEITNIYSYGSVNTEEYLEIRLGEREDKDIGTVKNKMTCATAFNSLSNTDKNSMEKRIELYKKYKKRNLLNLDKTTGAAACTDATCATPTKSQACLSANFKSNTPISERNLSCFTNTVAVDGKTAYCQTTLEVTNEVGKISFSGKSGQLYIKDDDGIATTSELGMTCYLFGSSVSSFSREYGNYLSNFQFDEEQYLDHSSNPTITLKKSSTNKYSGTVTVGYYFKKIYSSDITGNIEEVKYNSTSTCQKCTFLGYGKISKFTDKYTNRKIPFKFTLSLDENYNFSGNCTATVTPQIIIKDKPNLVFRTINTNITGGKDAFKDKIGKNRAAGTNWSGKESIIVTNNNSYNKNKAISPKYEITLTPSDIKKLRQDYKNKTYDNYEFTCKPITKSGVDTGDKICISTYLTTLKKSYGLQINNSKIRACFEGTNKTKTKCEIG